jgi:hypothetical protein
MSWDVVLRAARWDALEAVVPHITRLAQLEAARGEHRMGRTTQQAAETSMGCLLAIGEHIEGSACWMVPNGAPATLWQAVARATEHRMGPEQLAALYKGVKLQHERALGPGGSSRADGAVIRAGMCLGVLLGWWCLKSHRHGEGCTIGHTRRYRHRVCAMMVFRHCVPLMGCDAAVYFWGECSALSA